LHFDQREAVVSSVERMAISLRIVLMAAPVTSVPALNAGNSTISPETALLAAIDLGASSTKAAIAVVKKVMCPAIAPAEGVTGRKEEVHATIVARKDISREIALSPGNQETLDSGEEVWEGVLVDQKHALSVMRKVTSPETAPMEMVVVAQGERMEENPGEDALVLEVGDQEAEAMRKGGIGDSKTIMSKGLMLLI